MSESALVSLSVGLDVILLFEILMFSSIPLLHNLDMHATSFVLLNVDVSVKICCAGCCLHIQLPKIPTYSSTWVEAQMGVGKEGDNLEHGWWAGHRARGLFSIQSQYTALLQEGSSNC